MTTPQLIQRIEDYRLRLICSGYFRKEHLTTMADLLLEVARQLPQEEPDE